MKMPSPATSTVGSAVGAGQGRPWRRGSMLVEILNQVVEVNTSLCLPGSRSYDQYCPVAVALDVVGDRWTLLILRELLIGPRRFTDLRTALPGMAPNLLTDRLRDLQADGLIEHRELRRRRPGPSTQLTAAGRRAEPVLRSLARFGAERLGAARRRGRPAAGARVSGCSPRSPPRARRPPLPRSARGRRRDVRRAAPTAPGCHCGYARTTSRTPSPCRPRPATSSPPARGCDRSPSRPSRPCATRFARLFQLA